MQFVPSSEKGVELLTLPGCCHERVCSSLHRCPCTVPVRRCLHTCGFAAARLDEKCRGLVVRVHCRRLHDLVQRQLSSTARR